MTAPQPPLLLQKPEFLSTILVPRDLFFSLFSLPQPGEKPTTCYHTKTGPMREKRSHLKKQAMNSQDNSSDVPVFPRGRVREAFDFLTRRTNYESFKLIPYDQMARSLERLRAALEALGNPDRSMRVIHLAGTKGKGSVAAMLRTALNASGYRTGLYTSPHIHKITERFAIDGAPCAEEQLADAVFRMKGILEERLTPSFRPEDWTFFELATLSAFLIFQKADVQWAVLETGLGGRFDATNICRPEITVITSIGYDHCELLGCALEDIAFEKGGIIKPKVPVVSGVPAEIPEDTGREYSRHGAFRETIRTGEKIIAAEEVIRRIAHEKDAPLLEVTDHTPSFEIPVLAMPGRHQRTNARIALTTLDCLDRRGRLRLDKKRALAAIETTTLPARFEIVHTDPFFVIDGAHNRQSAAALADALAEFAPKAKRTLFFAISEGKDAGGMLEELLPLFDRVFLTTYIGPRAMSAEKLAAAAGKIVPALKKKPSISVITEPEKLESIVQERLRCGTSEELLCATGSFYFVAHWSK